MTESACIGKGFGIVLLAFDSNPMANPVGEGLPISSVGDDFASSDIHAGCRRILPHLMNRSGLRLKDNIPNLYKVNRGVDFHA